MTERILIAEDEEEEVKKYLELIRAKKERESVYMAYVKVDALARLENRIIALEQMLITFGKLLVKDDQVK